MGAYIDTQSFKVMVQVVNIIFVFTHQPTLPGAETVQDIRQTNKLSTVWLYIVLNKNILKTNTNTWEKVESDVDDIWRKMKCKILRQDRRGRWRWGIWPSLTGKVLTMCFTKET